MNPKSLVTNKYFLVLLLIYVVSFIDLVAFNHYSATELLMTLLLAAIIPIILAALFFKETPTMESGSISAKEKTLLFLCLIPIMTFIALGTNRITFHMISDPKWRDIASVIVKLVFFTLIPYLLFSWFDGKSFTQLFPISWKKKWLLPVIIMIVYFQAFQVLFGNGFKRLQEQHFSTTALLIGGIVSFIWQAIEAGVVEEFFFRGILQTHLIKCMKSPVGAILFSSLIFGLVHAPGLYLRPELSADILGENASFFGICCYTVCTNAVVGLFFGYIFWKTKSLLPGIIIHAAVDFLPGLTGFIETWLPR